ncbi:Gmad2 immunoglobulin-like domain-containing protein [Actinotalea sp. K2]|uniref:Gmad2 immunoglobulin-like domain-containing protein n=1 Tax=Actinotalea sp. K2 TaxID=2939438 RepID=UPI00201794F5|nr:Gmad2 immunoglobulin-like domain-containing protein [Actinotalea sp. K2]MCL3860592.1 hypothetical protein [Actinotalea sp. K2]
MRTLLPSARSAAALLVSAVLLTGCQTGADPGAEPSPEPTTTATDTPSPSPTDVEETSEPTDPPTATEGPVVNGPNSIVSPTPGETVTGPVVTISGEGTAYEATLQWRVLVAGTEETVQEGFTTAGANGEIGPYSQDVELAPGSYTVQVWEADISDGESTLGPYLNLVEVDFTVG